MNKNNLEFDVVSVDQRNLESLIVFQIDRVSSIVRRISVGQFIKSLPFELNFPISIGKSKWVLIVFLNGQYEAGQPNDLISIYLKLVQCEHQSAELKLDVKFLFGSESATAVEKNQRLCYADVKTRWLGAKLIKISEMILNQSRFIRDDSLMLTVSLNEHFADELSSSMEMSFDNSSSYLSESYPKSDNNYVDPPDRSTKHVPSAVKSNKSMFREEPFARTLHSSIFSSTPSTRNSMPSTTNDFWFNTPNSTMQKSDNASSSTNSKGQAFRRNIICDNNLNYVENEFSDDEDAKSTTDSKKGVRGFLESQVKRFFGKN